MLFFSLPLVFFIKCLNLYIQSFCLLWKVPGSMVSLPIGECRPAPGKVLWWQVWPLQGSCPPTPHSPCRWQTGHRTQSSELYPNCKTPSRALSQIPSTWINNDTMLLFLITLPFAKNVSRMFVWDLLGRTAVSATRNHCCGFGIAAAIWILHHLLLTLCLSRTVQHPVGHPSSTRYTADSLLGAPPGCDEKYNRMANTPSSEINTEWNWLGLN